ncbi:MAG: CsbD family protein [Pirellulaceae bacterium]
MNWDTIEGKWKEMKGHAKEKWGDLTDDDLDKVAGKRDQLAGVLQQKYGWAKDEVDRQIGDFEKSRHV